MVTYKRQPAPEPIGGELVHLLTEQYGPVRAFVLNYEWGAPASQNPWVLWFCARDGYALQGKLPQAYWGEINALLVPFGKHVCTLSAPSCSTCPLLSMCQQVGVTKHR